MTNWKHFPHDDADAEADEPIQDHYLNRAKRQGQSSLAVGVCIAIAAVLVALGSLWAVLK